MSYEGEDRRSGKDRRRGRRRLDDAPQDKPTNEEKQHDISWKFTMDIDRRSPERRSGEDRRKG